MIPNLQAETARFRERLKAGVPSVQVVNKEGYHGGGGAPGWGDLLLGAHGLAFAARRRT